MDYPNNFCIRHILSFVRFVELLVVEVHYLEMVLGRLRAAPGGFPVASPRNHGAWALQDALKKNLLRLTIGNNKGKHCYIVYNRFLKRTGQPCGAKLDQVTSGLGQWVSIYVCTNRGTGSDAPIIRIVVTTFVIVVTPS